VPMAVGEVVDHGANLRGAAAAVPRGVLEATERRVPARTSASRGP
jgi:hypothetical protein